MTTEGSPQGDEADPHKGAPRRPRRKLRRLTLRRLVEIGKLIITAIDVWYAVQAHETPAIHWVTGVYAELHQAIAGLVS